LPEEDTVVCHWPSTQLGDLTVATCDECTVAGASAPGLEIRSDHKGTLVRQLLQEGELITETGARRGECVAACELFGPRRHYRGDLTVATCAGTGPAR
jgi:hypothetical protein